MHRSSAWEVGAALALTIACAGVAHASDLKAWRMLSDSPAFPPTLRVPVGVYDPLRDRVLVVDVSDARQSLVVHVFEPRPEPRWSKLAASGEPPWRRYLASIVLDPLRDRLMVIGNSPGEELDVWAVSLSGSPVWERVETDGGPPAPRYGHATIYDPVADRVLMYGGKEHLGGFVSDVWELSLGSNTWLKLRPVGVAPAGREGHGAMYDPVRHRMVLFGGHYETSTRGFRNDVWQLDLQEPVTWSEISVAGSIPGARSAFGTVYDPVRRRMLVHGGVNAQSGIEPDDLWALALDGLPAWTEIVTEDTLRGRSYPVDVYDPLEDRLLACGGSQYPQTSALSLTDAQRWNAVLPVRPLPSPGARGRHAVVHDTRRDRFIVIGGDYSTVDSAVWSFDPQGVRKWGPVAAVTAPPLSFGFEHSRSAVYDSLGDRLIVYNGWQTWTAPGANPKVWTPLGPRRPDVSPEVGMGAALAVDSRRNRLIITGGWIPYPHGAGYTVPGVWSLSLGAEPQWSLLGRLPQRWGAASHASFYDPSQDRLVQLGGFEVNDRPMTRSSFGPTVWSTPVDSALRWTILRSDSVGAPPAPPDAHAAFDPRLKRFFIARDSSVWTRAVDSTGPWCEFKFSTEVPRVNSAISYDPLRDQLLALFATMPGDDRVQAWALAVGPLTVSLQEARRFPDAIELTWYSITAIGRVATLERRQKASAWVEIGLLEFSPEGIASYTDHDIRPGYEYAYRVSVSDGEAVWRSDPTVIVDPAPPLLTLLGAQPNPAVGIIALSLTLPGTGSARLEVFDTHGRRRISREVGALGPGTHTLTLPESGAWRPGMYWVLLRQGEEQRAVRVVLLR